MIGKIRALRILAAAFLFVVALNQSAFGADDVEDANEGLEEIIVRDFRVDSIATGSKTSTPLVEIPQSISVINAARIETIGALRLKEALAYTPGVNTSPWGTDAHYDWVYLRGFDSYSPGFYQDGMQLRNGGNWGVWQTENYGAERIEFLRGPSSALYGQNKAGGLVNVASKQPTERPFHEFLVQAGSFDYLRVAGDVSGPLDDNGDWLYRLTGLWQDAELSSGDLPNDRAFIAPAITRNFSSDTSLTMMGQFLRIRNGSDWRSHPAVGTLLPAPNGKISPSTFTGEPGFNRYDQDQWLVGYLFEHAINDDWMFRQNARFGEYDVDYKTFYSESWVTVNSNDPTDPANFQLLNRTPFGSIEDTSALTVDNQLSAVLNLGNAEHMVLFGLDYQRTELYVEARWGGSADPIDAYEPVYGSPVTHAAPFIDSDTTLTQTGLYVQDQIKFSERWILTLSGRYDEATIEVDDYLAASPQPKQTDREFTGRAGLVYIAPSGWSPYLSYSESFSPITTTNPDTGRPFDPETGLQYELGFRYQRPGSRDVYTIAVFDVRRQNHVIFDTQTFIPEQSGETQTRGVEVEAVARPFDGLNFTAAYAWTPKAEYISSVNPDQIGKQATPVPEHQVSLWADQLFGDGFNIGLGVRYTGPTRGFNEAAPAEIPSRTLLDALVAYDFGRWRLAVNVHNLTDEEDVTSCNGSGSRCYYGSPRRVIASANYRW